tara:strand:- start:237 stop:557 length:321 start_codon:yes stop_codon:yes gene_type:complete
VPISIHLLEPLTSVPKIGTINKAINDKKNKNIQILINLVFSKEEKKINIASDIRIKNKCFKKKWYEFVFSLSLAIKEVETKEKNNPKENKNIINNKITLSTLFHQS